MEPEKLTKSELVEEVKRLRGIETAAREYMRAESAWVAGMHSPIGQRLAATADAKDQALRAALGEAAPAKEVAG